MKDLKKDKTRHRGSLSQDKTQQRDHVEHVSPSLTFPLKLEPFFFFPFLCVLGANGRRVTGVGEQGQEQGSQEREAPWDRELASGSSFSELQCPHHRVGKLLWGCSVGERRCTIA